MDSITTVAKHLVPTSRRADFNEWVRGIDAASHAFEGYQGMELVHSQGRTDEEHYCVFRFDSEKNLNSWLSSDERDHWLADNRSCGAELFTARPYSSLEFWFTRPNKAHKTPSDIKMVVVTFAVIWPMVHLIAPISAYFVKIAWLSEMLTVAIVCALVTYVAMPLVTRAFGGWLFR